MIRVAAAQTSLGRGSYRAAMEGAVGLIERAAKNGAQVVCLPEHWLLEYREQAYGAVRDLVETARDNHIFIISGANYTRFEKNNSSTARIRSSLIGPDGGVIGSQDKVHLFRAEKEAASFGESFEVIPTPLASIGITVCYDNVFPEAARTLALKGADVLFVPSRIVSEGLEPWILYLRTRSLENRIPVVAPNVFHPPRYLGGSVIIDLVPRGTNGVVDPKIVASAGAGDALIMADIDLEHSRELRRERFADRRPESYSSTTQTAP